MRWSERKGIWVSICIVTAVLIHGAILFRKRERGGEGAIFQSNSLFHRQKCLTKTAGDASDQHIKNNTNTFLRTLQGQQSLPKWIEELCPSVYRHFTTFPYSASFVEAGTAADAGVPLFTTAAAAHGVCSLSVGRAIAASIRTTILLHAGSHLGAILHGGPIPWGDNIEALLPFEKVVEFFQACNAIKEIYPSVIVKCYKGANSNIKLTLVTDNSVKTARGWEWPFVDIFSYKIHEEYLIEVAREQGDLGSVGTNKIRMKFPLHEYFPLRAYIFGGLPVLGPQKSLATNRYDICSCFATRYLHRLEKMTNYNSNGSLIQLDCRILQKHMPFTQGNFLYNGVNKSLLLEEAAFEHSFAKQTWYTERDLRSMFRDTDPKFKHVINSLVPGMDTAEIDNSISNPKYERKSKLSVVEWNIERGSRWLESMDVLKKMNPDILILNEADIGMARTGQLHVARAVAFILGMNYAWGLEFLELTNGNREEQNQTAGIMNNLGLHGNAIISKYPIYDAKIIRNSIGDYFSNKNIGLTAGGFEKRLGGRMLLLANIALPENSVVVGSIHKLDPTKEMTEEILNYVGNKPTIIAGDQSHSFCSRFELKLVGTLSEHTWPASCSTLGNHKGDIICSNMTSLGAWTEKPCYHLQIINVSLSDHAIIGTEFDLQA